MASALNDLREAPGASLEPLGALHENGRIGGPTDPADSPDAPVVYRRRSGRPIGWLTSHPEWPIASILVLYPLWWALGIADFMWVIMAIPMLARIAAWRRQGRRLRVPPGFGLWLLFIICAVIGGFALTLTAPGTVPSPVSHRVFSYVNRTTSYMGITVVLLYACNLTERELSRRRLAWMLGVLAIYTTIGGIAGMVASHFSFASPVLYLLPKSIQSNKFIQASMHPGLSQIQNVIGTAKGRPKAPFDYTDMWGEVLTITAPWLLVGWWLGGTRRRRLIAGATLVIAVAPLLYSLDRGAWIGAVISVVYIAVRLAAKGRKALLGALVAGSVFAVFLVLATPLNGIINGRLHNGKSNNLRSNLSHLAIVDANASPFIGYGDTRQERGSGSSLAIGPSPACPTCGQQAVGSNGQLWLLFVCSGYLGAALYLGFFVFGLWRFRRDRSPYGLAGILVILLSFLYMFTYTAIGAPLGITVLVYALLWKNDPDYPSASAGGDRAGALPQNGLATTQGELVVSGYSTP